MLWCNSVCLCFLIALWCSLRIPQNRYNRTESTTAQTFSSASSVPLFGTPTGASVIKEFCQLTQQNGSAWPYPNQTSKLPWLSIFHVSGCLNEGSAVIVTTQQPTSQVAQDSNAQIGTGLDGLIGLGTNRGSPSNSSGFSANFDDSIMGQFFIRNPTAVNFTFGMMLNTPLNVPRGNNTSSQSVSGAGSSAGILHWLQPDLSAYDPNQVSWITANNDATGGAPTVATNTTGSGDWFVSLDGWVMVSGDNHLSNTKSVVATVDPLYPEMYLPADQAKLIRTCRSCGTDVMNGTLTHLICSDDAIPNATLRTDLSSLGALSQAWAIPCDSSFSFGLVTGSQTFTMDPNTLIISQPDGTCVSGIEGWTDTTQTTYLFGSRFLSTIYL